MASFVVLADGGGAPRGGETVFVRDEFSALALVFPLLWLLWHRLWFAAAMVLLATVGIAIAGDTVEATAPVLAANLLIGLLVAVEGPAWRIARHRRGGLADAGTVQAANVAEAELRWFTRARPARPLPARPRP